MPDTTVLPTHIYVQIATVAVLLVAFVVLAWRFHNYRKHTTREIERLRAEVTEAEAAADASGAEMAEQPSEADDATATAAKEQTKQPAGSRGERSIDPDKDFLDQIGSIIELNIANAQFSVNDLAEAAHMSRSVLFERIKSLTGSTPNNYIKTVRLERAAQLLSKGKHKVSDICDLVGFNTPSYFAKCFCERYGVMPKEYATRHAEHSEKN